MDKTQQKSSVELAHALKYLQETFLMRMELIDAIARETKAKYDALVSAGFTAEQALELCKAKAI